MSKNKKTEPMSKIRTETAEKLEEKLTPEMLSAMEKETIKCGCCLGHGVQPRYNHEQLNALKKYGRLPVCQFWTEYCSKENVVPRDMCYSERDPRGVGGCATANNCN